MNYIDIVILVVLGIFGIGGLRKGIITEAATLLGLGVGLYGAFHFSDFTAEKLVQWVEINPKYLNVISFVVTFLVLAIVVNLLGRLIAKMVKAINLGFVDKLGGFIVGMAKGVLLCSLLVMVFNALELKNIIKDKDKEESMLYPYVEQTVPYVYQGFDLVKEAVRNASSNEEDTPGVKGDTDEKAPTEKHDSAEPMIV